MSIKDFINGFVTTAESKIIELVNTELDNADKKAALDKVVADYVERAIDNLPINFLLKILLRKCLVKNIGVFTQAIYDLLKTKIKGLTKEG